MGFTWPRQNRLLPHPQTLTLPTSPALSRFPPTPTGLGHLNYSHGLSFLDLNLHKKPLEHFPRQYLRRSIVVSVALQLPHTAALQHGCRRRAYRCYKQFGAGSSDSRRRNHSAARCLPRAGECCRKWKGGGAYEPICVVSIRATSVSAILAAIAAIAYNLRFFLTVVGSFARFLFTFPAKAGAHTKMSLDSPYSTMVSPKI